MTIYTRIRTIRELRKYSQDYMAIMLGINQSSYNRLENGNIKLTVDRIQQIAEILEVSIETLLEYEGNFTIKNGVFIPPHIDTN